MGFLAPTTRRALFAAPAILAAGASAAALAHPVRDDNDDLHSIGVRFEHLVRMREVTVRIEQERLVLARSRFERADLKLGETERFEALHAFEEAAGAYLPDADTDSIHREMDALMWRAQSLTASTPRGFWAKVVIADFWNQMREPEEFSEISNLLRDLKRYCA